MRAANRVQYDVVVAGAGPAGTRVARDLARQGFRVAILERHAEVGVPCHCSGLVTPRTLERAAVGTEVVLNSIRGAELRLASGRSTRVGGDRIHSYVIDHVELDRQLARQALHAGATLLCATEFVDYELIGSGSGRRAPGHVSARVVRGGSPETIRAQLLVGADGARSRVAARLNGARHGGLVAGTHAVVSGVFMKPTDYVRVFLDAHAAPGWFGWAIPLGDGTARIGTGSANGITATESLARLARSFPETFGEGELHLRTGGTIPLWQPTRIAGDRVLLVGDAARQVKPTSGGGIHAALFAAELAAREAGRGLRGGDLSARSLRGYEMAWRSTLGREMRRQYDLRRCFSRLTSSHLERLFDALGQPSLRAAVDGAADVDFPSRVAWAIVRHDPLLAMRLATIPRFPMAWVGTPDA